MNGSAWPAEWQPIETAPKDGTILLLHASGIYDMDDPEDANGYPHAVHVGWWGDLGFWHKCGEFDWIDWHAGVDDEKEEARWDIVGQVTHWMPLPPPPGQPDPPTKGE